MARYKLVCTLGLGDILFQFILSALLTLVTFGLALPFFGYYLLRIIVSRDAPD